MNAPMTRPLAVPTPDKHDTPSLDVISLGCRLNISESEALRRLLSSAGAHVGASADHPGLVVINSCAVTGEAVRQTRRAIRRARRDHPRARLIVTGCAAEVERAALAAMPEVDGFVANTDKLDARAWNLPAPLAPTALRPAQTPHTRAPHTRAFVTVQNGCDHACSFCIIPQGRGPSRSRAAAEVVAEIAALADGGVGEVVLTGVDLTGWGHDLAPLPGAPFSGGRTPRLGDLVQAILRDVPALPRLRLSSLDGIEIDDALFDALVGEARVMPHVHLSLQHGADLILKRMKRRHLSADAVDLVARLQAHRPEIAIGADLIAGFPTETPAHHAENAAIIGALGIVHGHIFPFSPRAGTPAARMPQVPRETIVERAAELRGIVAAARARWLESLNGTPLMVLAERDGTGHAGNFARVVLPEGTPPGTILRLTPTTLNEGLLA